MKKLSLLLLLFVFIFCKNDKTIGATSEKEIITESSSENGTKGYPTKVFFGDTHLDTDISMDAGAFGNRIGMDEAYKFARGEEVPSTTGNELPRGRAIEVSSEKVYF